MKCVVWDLDNTLWQGTLLENDRLSLKPGVNDVIATLDRRGILHSIASRNDHDAAMAMLDRFGLAEYFLAPQINWGAKSASLQAVAKELNLGLDALAFVDDEPYEREEVAFTLPQVRCFDARDLATLPERPELNPPHVTADAARRRAMYQADARRRGAEEGHAGPQESFLASLGMRLRIAPAREEDLRRAEELTVRTNQLNTTGYTYSYAELDAFRRSDDSMLLVAGLEDKFGPYGTIGLALVDLSPAGWTLKLLLMSCRVMSRGVGVVLINHIRRMARDAGVRLMAEFVRTPRNRMMYVTYKFNNFTDAGQRGEVLLLEADLSDIPPDPSYLEVEHETWALTS
ncbi:HAD-IIIC family phosphatase [Nonomuraea sp. NPDC050404]|uniref:HAD-IIIC family phosphatase n=1 Tax=Nonomuraea sp. NPDC050404 TaxID=3155783 RepID=UPI0033E89F2E